MSPTTTEALLRASASAIERPVPSAPAPVTIANRPSMFIVQLLCLQVAEMTNMLTHGADVSPGGVRSFTRHPARGPPSA